MTNVLWDMCYNEFFMLLVFMCFKNGSYFISLTSIFLLKKKPLQISALPLILTHTHTYIHTHTQNTQTEREREREMSSGSSGPMLSKG